MKDRHMMEVLQAITHEIENYGNPNKDYESGYVGGLMWARAAILENPAYADLKINKGFEHPERKPHGIEERKGCC